LGPFSPLGEAPLSQGSAGKRGLVYSVPRDNTGVSGPPVTGIGIKKMSQKVNSKGFRLGEKTRFVAGTVAPGFQT